MSSMRRQLSSPVGSIIPVMLSPEQFQKLSLKSSVERSQSMSTIRVRQYSCRAKNSNDEEDDATVYDENGFDRNGFDRRGRDRYGRDRAGLDEEGLDKFGIPGDAILDGPIFEPEYHTYIDPNTGEPSPTSGFRNPLPNAAFWGDDLAQIQKSAPSAAEFDRPSRSTSVGDGAGTSNSDKPNTRRRRGSMKSKKNENSEPGSNDLSEEELANIAELQALRDKFHAGDEGNASKSIAQVIKERKAKERKEKEDLEAALEEGEDEEEEDVVTLGDIYGQNGFGDRGYALVSRDAKNDALDDSKPLTNDELWWNWQKPPADEKPWSAWQKRAGDSDTVMAAAMAETGQIKLFGEIPTIAEATLARARKRVFYNERMEAEEARKNEIGALAYYKEWVKGYKKDTSKEAVQKHFEETGEDEGLQLLDMFAYQTDKEYRIMQGTDIRIRRDPLVMRMRPDQIKQVWGGDPVYPTINYEQDPESVADYREENMHEPIPDIVEMLRESGRLITQAEVKEMLEREKIEDDELGIFDGLSGAVDIGEEDEDELDEDEEEVDFEESLQGEPMPANSSLALLESSPTEQVTAELDEVVDAVEDEVKDATLLVDDEDEI